MLFYIKDKNNRLVLKDLNKRRAIKALCNNCSAWATRQRQTCPVTECQLHPYRNGEMPEGLTPSDRAKAINDYCRDWCCMGRSAEVKICHITTCPLFAWRTWRVDRSTMVDEMDCLRDMNG